MGVSNSIVMWYVGGSIALPLTASFPPSPEEIFTSLQHPKITKLHTVTILLWKIVQWLQQNYNIDFQTLARLKFVAFGGASCPADICNELIERGVNLINIYGATGQFNGAPLQ